MSDAGPHEPTERDHNCKTSIDKSAISQPPIGPTTRLTGPRRFGRLLLLQPMARGGMGEVYLAAAGDIEGAERPCVVKLIREDHRADASFLARFLDEARIQAQMHHPGVAQILEAAIDPGGQPYVVVEYVSGRDLSEIRRRAAALKLHVGWADAVAIVASVADALAHVHERTDSDGRPLDVVHRDLSPQNIMVGYGGETKLIDFGTARGENRRCQTVSGTVFAKPGYVAPEVADDKPGGAPADLYALGVVLWELVAGRRFLQGDAAEHLAAVSKAERSPAALSAWLALPKQLDAIIAKLTAHHIQDRYRSAREAGEALGRLLQQAPGLANGERGVRARIEHLMLRLYPAEPTASRAEFARLVARARKLSHSPPPAPAECEPPSERQDDTLFPGTRYRIEREIAKSPMSVVYEAQQVDLGRKVALKVLDQSRCHSSESEASFREEARAVAGLKHENVVQIHDFGIASDGRPYYAMEYLEGESLAERVTREEPMPWPEALGVAIQACQALQAAHARGILHRDVKPGNLFITTAGTVKLLDFGASLTLREPRPRSLEGLSLLGTPEYMAPEQIGNGEVDERADVYALGAVLYELLSGELPHRGKNTVALLDEKVSRAPKPPSRQGRKLKLPRYLDRVVLTALATRTSDRYDDVTGLRQDLAWILAASRKRPSAQRRWLMMGGVAAAAAGLGVLAFQDLPPVRGSMAELLFPAPVTASPTPGELAAATRGELEAVVQSLKTRGSGGTSTAKLPEATRPTSAPEPEARRPRKPAREQPLSPAEEPAPATPKARALPEGPVKGERSPKLREALTRAQSLAQRNQKLRALEAYRSLGKRYPDDPEVLAGWSRIAARTKWWGESLRVAESWVRTDASVAAQLHLARTQHRVGQSDRSIATLRALLSKHPRHREAKDLLFSYGGTPVALK